MLLLGPLLGAPYLCSLAWQSLVPEGGRLQAAGARTRAAGSPKGAHGGCPNASISHSPGFEPTFYCGPRPLPTRRPRGLDDGYAAEPWREAILLEGQWCSASERRDVFGVPARAIFGACTPRGSPCAP